MSDTYKLLLLGDSSVGKTCILTRYTDNIFHGDNLSTIGIDSKIKSVTLENGKSVKVQIWDTAGQDRFKSMTKSFYKSAHGIVLVYDVTNPDTFDSVRKWIETIKEEAPEKVKVLLLGNKCDCIDQKKISKEEGQNIAKEFDLLFQQMYYNLYLLI